MSKVNFKQCPVFDTMDIDTIVIDAVKWNDDEYTAVINYIVEFSVNGKTGGRALTHATHLGADSIEELQAKVELLLDIGFFDGSRVSAIGTLYNSAHEEIDKIVWTENIEDDTPADEEITTEDELSLALEEYVIHKKLNKHIH